MIIRRRLLLQITPVLDMLLLVMFLQFMEMKQRTIGMTAQADATAVALAQAETDLAQVRQDADRITEQQASIARMVAEIFKLSPQQTQSLVRELQPFREVSQSTRDRMAQLTSGSPTPVVEHLLNYDEIRKRCDLWELYIDEQNVAHLYTGDRERVVRVETDLQDNVLIDEFVSSLETLYRELPQAKHLVVVLFSYHRDARLTATEGVGKALPAIVDRLNQASGGLTRFEYGDMGVRAGRTVLE